jgi:hypothetical protein
MNHRLEAKNCLAGMKELAAGSVDVVVRSPPYNLGVDFGTYKDDLPLDGNHTGLNAGLQLTQPEPHRPKLVAVPPKLDFSLSAAMRMDTLNGAVVLIVRSGRQNPVVKGRKTWPTKKHR